MRLLGGAQLTMPSARHAMRLPPAGLLGASPHFAIPPPNARHHPPPRAIDVHEILRVGGRVHAVVRRVLDGRLAPISTHAPRWFSVDTSPTLHQCIISNLRYLRRWKSRAMRMNASTIRRLAFPNPSFINTHSVESPEGKVPRTHMSFLLLFVE